MGAVVRLPSGATARVVGGAWSADDPLLVRLLGLIEAPDAYAPNWDGALAFAAADLLGGTAEIDADPSSAGAPDTVY